MEGCSSTLSLASRAVRERHTVSASELKLQQAMVPYSDPVVFTFQPIGEVVARHEGRGKGMVVRWTGTNAKL